MNINNEIGHLSPSNENLNLYNETGSLFSSTNLVSAPYVKVTIGDYTFGVYNAAKKQTNSSGVRYSTLDKYPNYIDRLEVTKINGVINQYNLSISYPITDNSDPNFFEKIFSSVSSSRKIKISYGDAMAPNNYSYKDEEAIISNITSNIDIKNSKISYSVTAVSSSKLLLGTNCTFRPVKNRKPSDVIKEYIKDTRYNLKEVFTGFKTKDINELIDSDDRPIDIDAYNNISVLDYLAVVVSYMSPHGTSSDSVIRSNTYSLVTYEDKDGPYFKVKKLVKQADSVNQLCTYEATIGYPSANLISSFSINQSDNWSILYDYNTKTQFDPYLARIDDMGNETNIYSPMATNGHYQMTEADKTWWTQMTQYPIKASITLRGLLRPAILMQNIKLNVYFYGRKHISSGVYIISSQKDIISTQGFSTTLELIKIAQDTGTW